MAGRGKCRNAPVSAESYDIFADPCLPRAKSTSRGGVSTRFHRGSRRPMTCNLAAGDRCSTLSDRPLNNLLAEFRCRQPTAGSTASLMKPTIPTLPDWHLAAARAAFSSALLLRPRYARPEIAHLCPKAFGP